MIKRGKLLLSGFYHCKIPGRPIRPRQHLAAVLPSDYLFFKVLINIFRLGKKLGNEKQDPI